MHLDVLLALLLVDLVMSVLLQELLHSNKTQLPTYYFFYPWAIYAWIATIAFDQQNPTLDPWPIWMWIAARAAPLPSTSETHLQMYYFLYR
jgi:hypothetical protein